MIVVDTNVVAALWLPTSSSRLAERARCSAYDCEFVVLAEDLGVPLLTHDRAVLAAFPKVARRPDAFVAC